MGQIYQAISFASGIYRERARLEATIALRLLAERMPGLSQAGAAQRRNAVVIRGPARLPVRAGRARAVSAGVRAARPPGQAAR
jgi:hypothetical protein